jgi:cytochrome c oxidase subunit 4
VSGGHRQAPRALASLRSYLMVWIALLALLALTLGSSYVPLHGFNSALNLAIACLKTLLVAFFFMRLRSDDALVRLIAAAAILWPLILIALSLVDVLTRRA